jgi:hypothetical protein
LRTIEGSGGEGLDAIYGFVGLPDGQVWAYGGAQDGRRSTSFIARVDRSKVEFLMHNRSIGHVTQGSEDASLVLPTTHIIYTSESGKLLVICYPHMFEVDARLHEWNHLLRFRLSEGSDTHGEFRTYPPLGGLVPITENPRSFIATSVRDGLVLVTKGTVACHRIPHQLTEWEVNRIIPAKGGTVLDGLHAWRASYDKWYEVTIRPPIGLDPGDTWSSDHHLLLDDKNNIVSVFRTLRQRGPTAVTRYAGDKGEVLFFGAGSVVLPSDVFCTPDGKFWNAASDRLLFLDGAKWRRVLRMNLTEFISPRVIGARRPWVLLAGGKMYYFDDGSKTGSISLRKAEFSKDIDEVHDAIQIGDGLVLLATDTGLYSLDKSTGRLSRPSYGVGKGIKSMCKDGLGRIWLGGEELWMIGDDSRVHRIDASIPLEMPIELLGPDSMNKEAVFLSLGNRGVLHLCVPMNRAEEERRPGRTEK